MTVRLTIMSLDFEKNESVSTKIVNQKSLSIGRTSDNDIVLESSDISKNHAKLDVEGDGDSVIMFITDLGSLNGTLVNNMPAAPNLKTRVAPNEKILIGTYLIKPEIIEGEDSVSDNVFEEEQVESKIAVGDYAGFTEFENDDMDIKDKPKTTGTLIPMPDFNMSLESEEEESKDSYDFDASEEFENSEEIEATDKYITNFDMEENIMIAGIASDSTVSFDFDAVGLCSLKGRVTNKGTGLADVEIDAGSIGFTTTDSDGYFEFTELDDGTDYKITAKKADYEFEIENSSGTLTDEDIEVEITAIKLVTITGRVMNKGVPLEGVIIDGGEILGTSTTDSDGVYSFTNVREGTEFKLEARKSGFKINKS